MLSFFYLYAKLIIDKIFTIFFNWVTDESINDIKSLKLHATLPSEICYKDPVFSLADLKVH